MKIGELRHQVKLQNVATAQNDYGEPVAGYGTYATVWAAVEPLQGRELEIARQISTEITHKVTIRHRDDVAQTDRIGFGNRMFEIISIINPQERDRMLILTCKEVV
mgnify:CR=1 FL=1